MESGETVLERGMRHGWIACLSGALLRLDAARAVGGQQQQDRPIEDFGMFLRLATVGDFIYVNAPLIILRAHEGAESSATGWFTGGAWRSSPQLAGALYERRLALLESADLDAGARNRLLAIAEKSSVPTAFVICR